MKTSRHTTKGKQRKEKTRLRHIGRRYVWSCPQWAHLHSHTRRKWPSSHAAACHSSRRAGRKAKEAAKIPCCVPRIPCHVCCFCLLTISLAMVLPSSLLYVPGFLAASQPSHLSSKLTGLLVDCPGRPLSPLDLPGDPRKRLGSGWFSGFLGTPVAFAGARLAHSAATQVGTSAGRNGAV